MSRVWRALVADFHCAGKRFALFKEIVPKLARVALARSPRSDF